MFTIEMHSQLMALAWLVPTVLVWVVVGVCVVVGKLRKGGE